MSIMFTKVICLFTQPQMNSHISPSLKASLLDMLLMASLVIVCSSGILNVIKAPPENITLSIYLITLCLITSIYLISRSKNRPTLAYLIFLTISWLIVTAINIIYQQVAISSYLSLTIATTLLINAQAGMIAGIVNLIITSCLLMFHNSFPPELATDRDIFFLVINMVNITLVYGIIYFVMQEMGYKITEHQHTVKDLKNETKHRFDKLTKEYYSVINTISEAVIITDMQLNIQTWNTASQRIYGYKEEDVLGKKLTDVIPTVFSGDENQSSIRQRHIEGGLWQNEVLQKRHDQSLIHALSSMSLIYDPDKKPIGAITVNQEITNYVQVEKELHRMNKKVLSTESLLQDIITLISEDHRQQVNALRSQSQILGYKADQAITDKIKQSINKLDDISNIILTIHSTRQQIEAGANTKLDLKQLVKEAFEIYRPIAEQKTIKFTLDIEEHIFPLIVKSDQKLLMRVINYYLNNAIQFTSAGGSVQVKLNVNYRQVSLTVSDTGGGMQASHQKAVFEPYFNYRYQYTSDNISAGLSLYVIKNIIIHYDGALIFESYYGKGSKFGFSLPQIIETVL